MSLVTTPPGAEPRLTWGNIAVGPTGANVGTLDDLPAILDLTVGPKPDRRRPRDTGLAHAASGTVGTLTARMQSDAPVYGELCGRIEFDPVPWSLEVTGVFGEEIWVTTVLSEAIDDLTVRLTAVDLLGVEDVTGSAPAAAAAGAARQDELRGRRLRRRRRVHTDPDRTDGVCTW